ncbi:MAG: hypothetical protein KGK12_15505, partial [Armatimonadetes bacterium]|nr:hypothetical protein [Armatimonadota bacterium]
EPMVADDLVQRVLGQVAAVYLDTIFRQNEVIGLSSGRAVFYTCESLFQSHIFDKRNLRGIRVMSLNGSITATPWSVQSPNARVAMDADASASWLARAFADVAQVRLSLPAALATPADVTSSLQHGPGMMISPQLWEQRLRSQPALAPVSDYEVVVPTLALVGVGAAHPDSGHRYITGCSEPHLEPVREHMVRLIEIARAIHKHHLDIGCAVGDICNRLFVTLTAQRTLPERLLAELERCVAEINCRLVSVSFDQLQMIPKVVAVAGGKTKVEAIRSVLEWAKMGWRQPLVHDLVTDSQTASHLIQAKHINRW